MPQPFKARARERGSVLVTVVILLVVLTIIALTLATRNSDEIDASGAKVKYDVAVTCADGARELLMSQFRAFGSAPTALVLDQTVGTKRYTTGHNDSFALGTVAVSSGSQSRAVGVSDAINRTAGVHLGGSLYRFTVVCTDTTQPSRQSEVEFLVRFGF
jgi:Tfp pilus assembly protein PilX